MPAKFSAVCAGIALLLAIEAGGGEEPPSPAEKEVLEIHVAPGFRSTQLDELVRQMGVPVFVDIGRDWNDNDSRGDLDYSKPAWPKFSFKTGTVGRVLEAFCRARPFQWRVWKGTNALWIEPIDVRHRSAFFYLRRPFKQTLALGVAEEVKGWQLDTLDVDKLWNETRRLPEEKLTEFRAFQESGPFAMDRVTPRMHVLKDEKESPKDAFGLAEWWLSGGDNRLAFLSILDQPGIKVGPERIVDLKLGEFGPDLSQLPIEQIAAGLFRDSKDPQGFNSWAVRRRQCQLELYRRHQYQPQEVLDSLRKQRVIERYNELSLLGEEMLLWDTESFGKFFINEFEASSKTVKLKIIASGILQQPEERGRQFIEFWQQLSRSEDQELKKKAEGALEWYRRQREAKAESQPSE